MTVEQAVFILWEHFTEYRCYKQKMNNRLLYIIDPYCIWCYGNISVINHLYDIYRNRVGFRVLPAGLWKGEKIREITPELERMLTYQSHKVGEITDTTFGKAFYDALKVQGRDLDSEIPSRAMVTIGEYWPGRIIPFCNLLLQSFFMYGLNLSEDETYYRISRQLELSPEEFIYYFKSKEIGKITTEKFEQAADYPAEYPSLYFVDRIGSVYPVSYGYTRFSQLQHRINQLL